MDATNYGITIRKVFDGSESAFAYSVKEFPLISGFAESFEEAYDMALEAIETLCEMAKESGEKFPAPLPEPEINVSGRITLRLPSSIHALAVRNAEEENISLNSYLNSAIAFYIGSGMGRNILSETFASRIAETASESLVRLLEVSNLEH